MPVTYGVIVALLLATLSIYLPPYARAFVGDDYVQLSYVRDFLERPFSAYQVFNPFWLPWYYRPFQNLWFLANRLIFGLNPFGYYYLQICLHLAAAALVYRVARQMGLAAPAALVSAALFAIREHHADVVAWISSIAIVLAAVFTLLAVSSYLSYRRRPARHRLLLTVLFFLLALLSHEEGFLLPPLLLFWRLEIGDWRLSISNLQRREIVMFLFMLLSLVAYLPIQLWRDNAVIDLGETPAQQWLEYLALDQLGRFVVETLVRILPFSRIEANVILLALLVLILLALWFWRGGRVVRLGLAWLVLHLAFIYWALWTQKPDFFAGRHIYNAWIGFTFALGAGIHNWRVEIGDWRSATTHLQSLISNLQLKPLLIGVAVTISLLIQVNLIRHFQADWVAMTQEQADAARQMKQIVPAVQDTHLFAFRFAIRPEYLPSFAEVWYGSEPPEPAGSLNQLQRHGRATDDFYLLDYENGQVYNLMPELQAHDETIFLWSQAPRVEMVGQRVRTATSSSPAGINVIVTGPAAGRRLALPVQPPEGGEWLSLVYVVTVPEQSQLRFGLRSSGRLAFRVRLLPAIGQPEILYETTLATAQGAWKEVVIPMAAYGGQPVVLRLETAGQSDTWGYWANPRFVLGD